MEHVRLRHLLLLCLSIIDLIISTSFWLLVCVWRDLSSGWLVHDGHTIYILGERIVRLLILPAHCCNHSGRISIIPILINLEHASASLRASLNSYKLVDAAAVLHDQVLLLTLVIALHYLLLLVRALISSKWVLGRVTHLLLLLHHLPQLLVSLQNLL